MSQEEKAGEAETENEEKTESGPSNSVYANFISRLILMIPLDSIKNIYSAFHEKRIKPTYPLPVFEEYYLKLLYEDGFAAKFIQSPDFIKKVTKSIPPTKEEEFFIYLTKKMYGQMAGQILTKQWRSKLLMQHSEAQIRKALEQYAQCDQTKVSTVISQFAAQIAHDESIAIGEDFSDEELKEANVSQELFEWWRNTLRQPDEKPNATDIDNSKMCDLKIELAEKALEFLEQKETTGFGVLHSLDFDFVVLSKHFLMHDTIVNEIDLDIKSITGYESSAFGSYGCLLMFKEDCEFYLENVGDAPILVDAIELRKGDVIYVKDNAIIEFGEAALVFKINWVFVNSVKKAMKIL